ncbi:hypothetical protein BDZ89DRAFT_1128056 [Hymenopellis radicata]|nr:hypothetical protein BDZ89DRAFT_1128056 [Hymenopellis radicata]
MAAGVNMHVDNCSLLSPSGCSVSKYKSLAPPLHYSWYHYFNPGKRKHCDSFTPSKKARVASLPSPPPTTQRHHCNATAVAPAVNPGKRKRTDTATGVTPSKKARVVSSPSPPPTTQRHRKKPSHITSRKDASTSDENTAEKYAEFTFRAQAARTVPPTPASTRKPVPQQYLKGVYVDEDLEMEEIDEDAVDNGTKSAIEQEGEYALGVEVDEDPTLGSAEDEFQSGTSYMNFPQKTMPNHHRSSGIDGEDGIASAVEEVDEDEMLGHEVDEDEMLGPEVDEDELQSVSSDVDEAIPRRVIVDYASDSDFADDEGIEFDVGEVIEEIDEDAFWGAEVDEDELQSVSSDVDEAIPRRVIVDYASDSDIADDEGVESDMEEVDILGSEVDEDELLGSEVDEDEMLGTEVDEDELQSVSSDVDEAIPRRVIVDYASDSDIADDEGIEFDVGEVIEEIDEDAFWGAEVDEDELQSVSSDVDEAIPRRVIVDYASDSDIADDEGIEFDVGEVIEEIDEDAFWGAEVNEDDMLGDEVDEDELQSVSSDVDEAIPRRVMVDYASDSDIADEGIEFDVGEVIEEIDEDAFWGAEVNEDDMLGDEVDEDDLQSTTSSIPEQEASVIFELGPESDVRMDADSGEDFTADLMDMSSASDSEMDDIIDGPVLLRIMSCSETDKISFQIIHALEPVRPTLLVMREPVHPLP